MNKRLASKTNPFGFERGDKVTCINFTENTRTEAYPKAVGLDGEVGATVNDICEIFCPSRNTPRAKRFVVLYTDLVPQGAGNKQFKVLLRRR